MTGQANQILNWENELAVRARQQAVVAELGQRALEGAELDELLNETAQQVAQTLEVEYCEVLELLPEEDSLLLRAGFGWTPGLVGKARIGADLESQAGYTLFTRQPVIVEDLNNETRFKGHDLLLKHGVVSGLSVIIQGPGRPFGVLGAFTRSTRVFTTDDIHFFKSIANILAAAIQRKGSEVELQTLNANLEQRVIERTGYLRMLHMVGIAANQAVSAEPVLRFVLEKVCAFTGWPVGHVYFQRAKPDSNGEQELVSSDLWHLQDKQRFAALVEATAKTRLAPGEDLPGEVIRRGEAVWIIDVSEDKNFVRNRINLELGVKSGFAFPVLVGSETAAVMEFFSDETAEPTHGMLDVMEQV